MEGNDGCGALAWYQCECGDLEVMQNRFGRWLCEVGKVRNELLRGESGWSSFAEREVKGIVDCLLRIVYEDSLVSGIGRACLMENGFSLNLNLFLYQYSAGTHQIYYAEMMHTIFLSFQIQPMADFQRN